MSDNIYRVLMGDDAPFSGLANISYYDRILRGRIVKVHYNIYSESSEDKKQLVFNQQSYRTVDINWLEGKPFTSENVHIPELVSFLGYGLNYLPSVDDVVIAGFDSTDTPHVLSIVARCSAYEHGAKTSDINYPVKLNKYGDVEIDTTLPKQNTPTPIRYIIPGEISLTSLNNNSELYFDKYGTAKLISRVPVLTKKEENNGRIYQNGQQCGDRLWEISVGENIIDEGNKEIKKSSFGNNVEFQILGHQNGCKVDFDSKGNIELSNKGNNIVIDVNGNYNVVTSVGNTMSMNSKGDFLVTTSTGNSISLTDGIIRISDNNGNSITMNSSGIQLGDNANFSAVLGESLNALLTSMITIFNSHTHLYIPGSGDPAPTQTTLTPMILSDVLSKTIKLKQ